MVFGLNATTYIIIVLVCVIIAVAILASLYIDSDIECNKKLKTCRAENADLYDLQKKKNSECDLELQLCKVNLDECTKNLMELPTCKTDLAKLRDELKKCKNPVQIVTNNLGSVSNSSSSTSISNQLSSSSSNVYGNTDPIVDTGYLSEEEEASINRSN
jgi:hypothetical protein